MAALYVFLMGEDTTSSFNMILGGCTSKAVPIFKPLTVLSSSRKSGDETKLHKPQKNDSGFTGSRIPGVRGQVGFKGPPIPPDRSWTGTYCSSATCLSLLTASTLTRLRVTHSPAVHMPKFLAANQYSTTGGKPAPISPKLHQRQRRSRSLSRSC